MCIYSYKCLGFLLFYLLYFLLLIALFVLFILNKGIFFLPFSFLSDRGGRLSIYLSVWTRIGHSLTGYSSEIFLYFFFFSCVSVYGFRKFQCNWKYRTFRALAFLFLQFLIRSFIPSVWFWSFFSRSWFDCNSYWLSPATETVSIEQNIVIGLEIFFSFLLRKHSLSRHRFSSWRYLPLFFCSGNLIRRDYMYV